MAIFCVCRMPTTRWRLSVVLRGRWRGLSATSRTRRHREMNAMRPGLAESGDSGRIIRRVTEHDRPAWRSHCYVFRGLDFAGALDLLSALNVASTLQDLSPLKSVGLHKLK